MHTSGRRSSHRAINVWPGWVDALSSLVMVVIFLLMVFVVTQFYMATALTGRNKALDQLQHQVAELGDLLNLERQANADLTANAAQLSNELQNAIGAREEMTAHLAAVETERDELAARAARLAAQAQQTARDLEDANKVVAADREKIAVSLRELANLQADIRALRAMRTKLEAQVAGEQELSGRERQQVEALNRQLTDLRDQIARLNAALEASEARSQQQNLQIADLGGRLNLALASRVEELARYRSEFFGRLRGALGNRPDVRIAGDRFVFQSEVLFPSGSATLEEAGKGRLAELARTLIDIAQMIPPDVNWVLRIDGHTDRRRIATAQFASNWELSAARAISVVKFLGEQGIPAERLAAAGFGEFQPLDPGNTDEAYTRNRRIEIKFDQR